MNLNDIVKIQDVDLKGKTVLMRVDYNVPLKDGKVDNPKRITATEKTVKYLLSQGCKVVLIAHLGRPKGQRVPEFSLAPVAPEVEKIMGTKVHFGKDCVGPEALAAVAAAKPGEIVLLENLRYHPEEEKNDENINPGYFAIIPGNIRYDKTLCPNAKLLYGEITSLCNKKGHCWASNSYFSKL